MKKVLLSTALFLFALVSYSQDKPFSVGVKAGVNLSNFSAEDTDTKSRVGYQFGIVGEYQLPNSFFLQSGMNISSKGAKIDQNIDYDYNGDGYSDYGYMKIDYNAVYLQLPILAGYKIDVTDNFGIKLFAGPYLAYGIGGKSTLKGKMTMGLPYGESETIEGKEKADTFSDELIKRFDMGLLGGVTAQYGKLSLSLGYEYGITDISQGTNSIHNQNAFATIGYTFY